MKLEATIYCTFGGGSGGSDTASSTAPIGQHPETDGTVGRNKMRKGGPDKGGVQGYGTTEGVKKEWDVRGRGRSARVFESKPSGGMRPMQYKFLKNGRIKVRVVGKGSMFTWQNGGSVMPGETPEGWMKRMGKTDLKEIKAQQITDPDTREFIKETKPSLLSGRKKRAGKTKPKAHLTKTKASLRGTSGGQSEGSSLTKVKFYVVDGQGRVLHTFRTREEAEQASAGNRYTRVVTRIQQSTPLSDTPEVRDMARKRLVSPVTTFRRALPYPGSLGGIFPGSGQGR